MSHAKAGSYQHLFSEPEITAEQQQQVIDAVRERVILGPSRVPLHAEGPTEGQAWTGFIHPQGVVLAGIKNFTFQQKEYSEYGISIGAMEQDAYGNTVVHEKELAILTNGEDENLPRSHEIVFDCTEIRKTILAGHPIIRYVQLSSDALRMVTDANKRNYTSANVALAQQLSKQREEYKRMLKQGIVAHGATEGEAEKMLELISHVTLSSDIYTPNDLHFEVSELDIKVLGELAEKCARDSILSQRTPERFNGYDPRAMRTAQASFSRHNDGRIALTVRIEHTYDRSETFTIMPSGKYGHSANYSASGFTNGAFAVDNPTSIDRWAARKTNITYPPGSKPMTRAHHAYLADILTNLRFDD